MPRSVHESPVIRVVVALTMLAALAVVAAAPSRSSGGGGGEEIGIQVKNTGLLYKGKRRPRFKGHLRSHPAGVAFQQVQLKASLYPYNREKVIATDTTDLGGNYSFSARPSFNTRYRVVAAGYPSIASVRRQVWVYARGGFSLEISQARPIARARMFIRYSPKVHPGFAGKRLYWYFRKLAKSRFKVVETTRVKHGGPGRVEGQARLRLPPSRRGYRFQVLYCFEAPGRDAGVGNDKPLQCPRSFRIRRSSEAARAAGGLGSAAPFNGVAGSVAPLRVPAR